MNIAPLLEIENLVVHFTTRSGIVHGARGVSLHLGYGETLGIVGESGSGKSVTVQAVMGLITGKASHCSVQAEKSFSKKFAVRKWP